MYIKKFNEVFLNEEINFSPNFDVSLKDKELQINEVTNSPMKNFYGDNIINISALIGKNGSGKTTILDILGMNRNDRSEISIKKKKKSKSELIDEYFTLYHIQEDYYVLEVMSESIENIIMNIDFHGKIDNAFYKIPIGIIIKKTEGAFIYVDHIFQKSELGYRVLDRISFSYISTSYSNRIHIKDYSNNNDSDYLFERKYFTSHDALIKYKLANDIINLNNRYNIFNTKTCLEITPQFDYASLDTKLEEWIKNLEDKLHIYEGPFLGSFVDVEISSDQNILENKEIFILDTVSSYIIDMFIHGVCGIIDNKNKRNKKQGSGIKTSSRRSVDSYLKLLTDNIYIDTKELGELTSNDIEYEYLLQAIDFYNSTEYDSYKKLIFISRFLSSRLEYDVGLGSDNKYQVAIEDFINSLLLLEPNYFTKDKIVIRCQGNLDNGILNTFKIFDEYSNNRYNDLTSRFEINYKNLSEGQERFLDLIAKINDAIYERKDDYLSILLLDEPDGVMHPEWSRRFIQIISDEIIKYNSCVQIVLSTHSPFILSDFTPSNSIFLKQTYKKCEILKEQKTNIFGANIHNLLLNNFFMDSTIGEFAKTKIEDVIKYLLFLKELKQENKKIPFKGKKFSKEEMEKIISLIGEPIIQKKVKELITSVFDENNEVRV